MISELLKLLGQAADNAKSLHSRLDVNDQDREKLKADLSNLENQFHELHRRINALSPDEAQQISNVPAAPEPADTRKHAAHEVTHTGKQEEKKDK
jgi:phage shock protein A